MKEIIIKIDESKKDIMDGMPLVEQAKELIRCKDCKHGIEGCIDRNTNKLIYIVCDNDDTHDPDWYCADGERK